METVVIVLIGFVVLIFLGLIIGLVIWLILRNKNETPTTPNTGNPELPEGAVDPCKGYSNCSVLQFGNYYFRSLNFTNKKIQDTETKNFLYNQPSLILEAWFGCSSQITYTLSDNKITASNRNSDNYLRCEKRDGGRVYFGWGNLESERLETVFWDNYNLVFYDPNDSSNVYILLDPGDPCGFALQGVVQQMSMSEYFSKSDSFSFITIV
jgi:hypothetical protein